MILKVLLTGALIYLALHLFRSNGLKQGEHQKEIEYTDYEEIDDQDN